MQSPASSLGERFVASMVLSGVGDAIGYRNGSWEFCKDGEQIHKELKKLGGVKKIKVSLPDWCVSDDTVMHLATAEALIAKSGSPDKEALYQEIAAKYKECMKDMNGRAPGLTCCGQIHYLDPEKPGGWQRPFSDRGGGCGAAMRAMCIGLRYPKPEDLDDLIAVSVESGRMSHHHPTGYLGSFVAALFTAYAIQGKPLREWGASLVATLPRVLQYVKDQGRFVTENENAWSYFENKWKTYLRERQIEIGKTDPVFPANYGIKERDALYTSYSFSGWGGSSGHDSVIISYDALLGCSEDWEELCKRGMFHGGDSDSTGAISGAWFGAIHGFKSVPSCNYEKLEYRERLVNCGEQLLCLSGLSA